MGYDRIATPRFLIRGPGSLSARLSGVAGDSKESLGFPRIEQFAMADQIRRASKSICANVAEGFAKQRRSSAEYRRYLLMAIGSADELMRVWIRYCLDLNYIDVATSLPWRDDYGAI